MITTLVEQLEKIAFVGMGATFGSVVAVIMYLRIPYAWIVGIISIVSIFGFGYVVGRNVYRWH